MRSPEPLSANEKTAVYVRNSIPYEESYDLISGADKVIVPGVGAFEQAMHNMKQYQLFSG